MCTTVEQVFERFKQRHEQMFEYFRPDSADHRFGRTRPGYRLAMDDLRAERVGDNLLAFLGVFATYDGFEKGDDPEVVSFWSDLPFPLFNAVVGGRFAPGATAQRARQVIAPYLERGLPFLWWATPDVNLPELRAALVGAGLTELPIPGMYLPLHSAPTQWAPAGVELRVATEPAELDESLKVMFAGFEMPDQFRAGLLDVLPLYGDSVVQVLALADGEPTATGTLFIDGTTAGLYNIATLAPARGRGLGYAVTVALLNQAVQRGCDHAILHSSDAGYPIYLRLGFKTVCEVPQFVWLPG
jgi:GNAT superfamily N-acetyltransferase